MLNTRGLTELIVLVVGLQLAVVDRQLYSLMVVMALVTTAMAGVVLRFIQPASRAEALIRRGPARPAPTGRAR